MPTVGGDWVRPRGWAGGWGQDGRQLSASTVLVWGCLLVSQLWALLGARDCGVGCVQRLGHLLADDIHQALKGLLDINIVLGACLKELKPCGWGREGEDLSTPYPHPAPRDPSLRQGPPGDSQQPTTL